MSGISKGPRAVLILPSPTERLLMVSLKAPWPLVYHCFLIFPSNPQVVRNTSEIEENEYSKDLLQIVSTNQAFEDITSGKADIIIATKPININNIWK